MNFRWCALAPLLLGAGPLLLRAQSTELSNGLSVTRIDLLDERGYFTPRFKKAVHDLVDARQGLARARANEEKLHEELPGLQNQSAAAAAEVGKLREELSLYAHPEDADYQALQAAMKNPVFGAADRLSLAQAFVWSYPTDPREVTAQMYLRQIQDEIADADHRARLAEAARAAAQASLLQRVKAHNLSLSEWQNFLRERSQEEVLQDLGPPQAREADYWIYTGSWTSDPVTRKRTGLQINFNGTRVLSVAPSTP